MIRHVTGGVIEHWMDKSIREHKPINYEGNLIRISAVDLLTLIEYKNKLLGVKRTLLEEQEEYTRRELEKVHE